MYVALVADRERDMYAALVYGVRPVSGQLYRLTAHMTYLSIVHLYVLLILNVS
jgi:hypothetical protein